MNAVIETATSYNDVILLKLAREIAMDIRPLEDVLTSQGIGQSQWEEINKLPYFQQVLRSCLEEWQSAQNTPERVKLKTLAMVEEALPEFHARMHDPREQLQHKTDVLKTIAKFAGIDRSGVDGQIAGERMVVTINLGADHQLKIEKDVTPKTIEGEIG